MVLVDKGPAVIKLILLAAPAHLMVAAIAAAVEVMMVPMVAQVLIMMVLVEVLLVLVLVILYQAVEVEVHPGDIMAVPEVPESMVAPMAPMDALMDIITDLPVALMAADVLRSS